MSPDDLTLLVLAKEPIPGKVKTRLTPTVSPQTAADLAKAALRDTLETVAAARGRRRVLVLDGEPADWVPDCFEVIPQASGGLDQRLAGAFAAVEGPALLVGMDTPQIMPDDLALDFSTVDSWVGPTFDGGYWAIAMREPNPEVFPGVPMSTDHTCRDQISRLIGAGMSVGLTTMYRDVDTMQDAHLVAHDAPGSRFALELGRTLAPDGWPAADDAYEAALLEGDPLHFSVADGRRVDLDISRWRSEPDEADLTLLSRCRGATLDIGCGPGRLTAELGKQGRPSLGVDVTPTAVDLTRAAGGTAICRSVFDELPGEGAWDTVLLADGNLGISGDPNRLLTRVRELLRPGGVLLIEPVPIDADEIVPVRLSNGSTIAGPPFLWAHIGPDAAHRRVLSAGFVHTESWTAADRCFMAFTKS